MIPRANLPTRMMHAAWLASESSTCLRRKCGCVAVDDGCVLLYGFNGAPRKEPHCDEVGCRRAKSTVGQDLHRCRGLHAEAALITIAADLGIALNGVTFYCTHRPCSLCMKLIANIRDVNVFYDRHYPDPYYVEMQTVKVEQIEFDNG